MEQDTKFKVEIGAVVAIIIVAVLAYFGWRAWRSGEATPEEPAPSLGQQVGESVNPAAEVPETNPFKKTETNPFEGVYKNPFD